ncbi:MAG: biotin/lipoyl-binding protein [Pirellula sp.]
MDANTENANVLPVEGLCLEFRKDLIVIPQEADEQSSYFVVEDPVAGRFFRLGKAEVLFAEQLDGQTTLRDAFANLSSAFRGHPLTEEDSIQLAKWLAEMELAVAPGSKQHESMQGRCSVHSRRQRQTRWNPLALRMGLWNPDATLEASLPYVRFLFHRSSVVVWGCFLLLGATCVAWNWNRFQATSTSIFSVENGSWLATAWLLLKLIHECAHAMTCKRFGGTVGECGIQCSWFVPMPYVDVTSCWRFGSRWPRIAVALAGMYAEIWIASIAAIVWAATHAGSVNHLAYNLVWMASVTTLLFNANPLMKLDGYYAFADWLGLQNLYQRGQRSVRELLASWAFGLNAAQVEHEPRGEWITRIYGWLSLAWRVCLSIAITIAMAKYSGEAGALVAMVLVAMWAGPGAFQSYRWMVANRKHLEGRYWARLTVVSIVAITAVTCLFVLPMPFGVSAPGVVGQPNPEIVRAKSAGRVVALHVAKGQHVQKGDLILSQENAELSANVAKLELRLQQSVIRQRRFEQKGQMAAKQAEREEQLSIEEELESRRSELDSLFLRAPHAGIVLHSDPQSLIGRYLKSGDETLVVTSDSEHEIRLSIAQEQCDSFYQHIGRKVQVDVAGQPLIVGVLEKIVPRASSKPIHDSLMSVNGGSLPVHPIAESRSSDEDRGTYELLAPHLQGIVRLDPNWGQLLFNGQRATIRLGWNSQSIGSFAYGWIASQWRSER